MTRERNTAPLQPGEFYTQVVEVSGQRLVNDRQHAIGYASAERAARAAGLEELCFGDSAAVVLVTDHLGVTRRFEVTMKIRTWGEVKELT
jgi:hypothetical protein